jgi:hypothetical protein
MKTKIYQAGEPITDKWVLQWQSDSMPAAAFWYYDTEEEAEAARVQMIAGDSGISSYDNTVYTYRHAEKIPDPGAKYYKITCYIDYSDSPIHINTYYVPGEELDDFFITYAETGEVVTDIRPATEEEMPKMIKSREG